VLRLYGTPARSSVEPWHGRAHPSGLRRTAEGRAAATDAKIAVARAQLAADGKNLRRTQLLRCPASRFGRSNVGWPPPTTDAILSGIGTPSGLPIQPSNPGRIRSIEVPAATSSATKPGRHPRSTRRRTNLALLEVAVEPVVHRKTGGKAPGDQALIDITAPLMNFTRTTARDRRRYASNTGEPPTMPCRSAVYPADTCVDTLGTAARTAHGTGTETPATANSRGRSAVCNAPLSAPRLAEHIHDPPGACRVRGQPRAGGRATWHPPSATLQKIARYGLDVSPNETDDVPEGDSSVHGAP
jgi:hypothetical protein